MSKSGDLSAKVIYEAMKLIDKNGGAMPLSDLYNNIEKNVSFTGFESDILSSGLIRWKALLGFISVEASKAGMLVKKNGTWHITEDGSKAISTKSQSEFFDMIHSVYQKWHKSKKDIDDIDSTDIENNEDGFKFDEIQNIAREGIKDFIIQKNPWEFQDLVASLLRAMGYYTPFIAPKGKDGGIDIVAYQDPLGTSSPQLKVQVKHYPLASISVEIVRSLAGILVKDSEVGIIVTSGKFTADAKKEARNNHRQIRLIDMDELIDLWITYYDKVKDEDKFHLPITPVFFIDKSV